MDATFGSKPGLIIAMEVRSVNSGTRPNPTAPSSSGEKELFQVLAAELSVLDTASQFSDLLHHGQ